MRRFALVAALCVLAARVAAADAPQPYHKAVSLDRHGELSVALPLYRAKAEQTETRGDRLRYASALLRSGRTDDARRVYAELMLESGSVHHGGAAVGDNVPLCASSVLRAGFPAIAVEYLVPAHRARPGDTGLGLLYARALLAAGDVDRARAVVREIARDRERLVIGQRIELARAYLFTGDVGWTRRLLETDIDESVGQMLRDSILANVAFRERDWARVATGLADAKRKAPASLGDKRVDRSWRNLQRELRSIQLRRAVALWNQGKREDAVDEASGAEEADEEYVRSAAILLLAAGNLADGKADAAIARLKALGGHDVRFAEPVARLGDALVGNADASDAIAGLDRTLSAEDHAHDFVTKSLVAVVSDAAQIAKAPRRADATPR